MSYKREHKLFIHVSIIISLILDLSSVILNGLIAYVLQKHKKTKVVTFWFIFCLSCSDTLVGITGLLYHSLELGLVAGPSRSFWDMAKSVASEAFDCFLSTSGHLVFIIAIDRCIHMRYLHKYSTLMTEIRARLLLLLNVFLAILFSVLPFLFTKSQSRVFYFCVNIFHTFCTVLIYVTYATTYFSIKKQVASIQQRRQDHVHSQNNLDMGRVYSDNYEECTKLGKCGSDDSNKRPGSLKACIIKNAKILQVESKTLNLAECTDTNPESFTDNIKSPDHCSNEEIFSNIVKNTSIYPASEVNINSIKEMASRQTTIVQSLDEVPKRMRSKTEQEFRKATLLILFALSICYCPRFIHRFYVYATQDKYAVYYLLTGISLLLNSSLNAIVLIACSKEIQRYIKEIFFQD